MLEPNALPFATDKVCENKYIAARWARMSVAPTSRQLAGLAELASLDAHRIANALRGQRWDSR